MPKRQYQVSLSETDRDYLKDVIATGRMSAREIRRAHTLLLSDEKKQDQDIAAFFHIHPNTVTATRQRYCEVGLPEALKEKARPGNPPKLDGKQSAYLVALACTPAPNEREQWTLQLLADKLVELEVIETPVSDDTIGRVLKKMRSNLG